MKPQQRNLVLFVILSSAVILGWTFLRPILFPVPPPQEKGPDASRPPVLPKTTSFARLPAGQQEAARAAILFGLASEQATAGYIPPGVIGALDVDLARRNAAASLAGQAGLAAAGDAASFLASNHLVALADYSLTAPAKKPDTTPPVVKKPAVGLPPVILGSDSSTSSFFLLARLTARGAAVRQVVLNRFQKADSLGRPVWKMDGDKVLLDDKGQPVPEPLELVTEQLNSAIGSNLLYHSPDPDNRDQRPIDTLGETRVWNVETAPAFGTVESWDAEGRKLVLSTADGKYSFTGPGGGEPPAGLAAGKEVVVIWSFDAAGEGRATLKQVLTPDTDSDLLRKVVFSTTVQDVVLTKTFTLDPGNYHLGLDVQMQARPGLTEGAEVKFRYHLTSGHGLPIEGAWYTNTFRNSLIGLVDQNGAGTRNLQDLRRVSQTGGGEPIAHVGNPGDPVRDAIQYGGTSNQFFASVVAVDDFPPNSVQPQMYIDYARPTVVSAALHGQVVNIDRNGLLAVLSSTDKQTYSVVVPKTSPELWSKFLALQPGAQVGLTALWTSRDEMVAQEIYTGDEAHKLLFYDVNVHLVSDVVRLKPGQPVTHHYVLYNGPLKVRLLSQLEGDRKVADDVVALYHDKLHLNTLTDAPWEWWGKGFFTWTGLTSLLLATTNLMHSVLWLLHTYVFPWSWGVCIILLTILVRGLMHPLSRRATLNSLRMQAMQPELKKLREKYKDDPQAMGMAQMDLYRKHKVSLFGSCWTMFLQMPIFMGLYWCLQESIHFRLAPLIPDFTLWIPNLAAPDMLIPWTGLPFVSDPQYYGSFFYLGPYFNLLPCVAAGLMLFVQKMMMPPPSTEQEEMQQKMMRWMPIVMGIIFFKVASGLCLYFITSSLWGLIERKLLLPKKAPSHPDNAPTEAEKATPDVPPSKPGFLARIMEKAREAQAAQQAAAAGMPTAAPRPDGRNAEPGSSRKNRRQRKRDRQKGRKGGVSGGPSTPASPASNGGGSIADKLKAWWKDVLRKAEKR